MSTTCIKKKIVHRDLKSANILVKQVEDADMEVEYVQVKVNDFGLSKTKETSISNSIMSYNVGTSRWMAPEIIKLPEVKLMGFGSTKKLPKYNFKGDIYSFGMVCYEILTGDVPFQDEGSEREVKKMVLEGIRPQLPYNSPPRLIELIKTCWSQDPMERPTIGDICLELKYLKYLLLTGNDAAAATTSTSSWRQSKKVKANLLRRIQQAALGFTRRPRVSNPFERDLDNET